jgi:ABC-type glycerol-3-phosphate transport system substrate-binding protein
MKVRILSILMVLCLLIAMPACSSNNAGQNANSTTVASQDNSVAAPAEDKNVLPYKGDEVKISMLGWESYKDIDPSTQFGKWFQEKLGNIKLEIEIPAADTQQKCDLYLASGDMPDIMVYREADKFMRTYGDGSRTVNLLDYAKYMPEYTERRKTFPHLSWYDKDNAAYIYFPSWYDCTSETWFQNQDLMTKYNLKTPTN